MTDVKMPSGKYFISHSYWDRVILEEYTRSEKSTEVFDAKGKTISLLDVIDEEKDPVVKMRRQIAHDVEFFIFPSINVSPQDFVSNALIEAILDCDGVIYLTEGFSSKSFWVAFERDYALRTGKRIYRYTPSKALLESHTEPPLDLAIFPSFAFRVEHPARAILRYLSSERYFDIWLDTEKGLNPDLRVPKFISWLEQGEKEIEQRGGYVVGFFDEEKVRDGMRSYDEMRKAQAIGHLIVANIGQQGVSGFPDELVINLVDDIHGNEFDVGNFKVSRRKIDDLIVRLYWLIFRNQFPELVYD